MTDDRTDDLAGDLTDKRHDAGHGEEGSAKRTPLIIKIFLVICVVLLLLDFVIHRHVSHPWENLFGFHAVFGFVACVLLVLSATQMRRLLMRSEDYYDAD